MLAVTIRETNGAEHRMIRSPISLFCFVEVVRSGNLKDNIKNFMNLWEKIGDHIKEMAGLYPFITGLVVIDFQKKVIYADIDTPLPFLLTIPDFDCKIYPDSIIGFLEMKDELKKGGFKITKKEEFEWGVFLDNLNDKNHVVIKDA